MNKKIFVYGFPEIYGGANTELYHQIILWLDMGKNIHIVNDIDCFQNAFLYKKLKKQGVVFHEKNDWKILNGNPIISFCNRRYLQNLKEIKKHTDKTIYVNCMCHISPHEMQCVNDGLISMLLYQNDDIRLRAMQILKATAIKNRTKFRTFTPFFDNRQFPFTTNRPDEWFGCGHISRFCADKFSKLTLPVYERFVSPVPKRGMFLGCDSKVEKKIGKPFSWIKSSKHPFDISPQEFYRHCNIVLQPSDIEENWPRIGFEAMSSGSVLIVDNRGGWKKMIKHGKTGWLCNTPRDFIYYASKMAYEPSLRNDMASAAREYILELGEYEQSRASWEKIFLELDGM